MRSAEEIITAIHGCYHTGSKHGLTNMEALLAELHYSARVPVIHVAGTNGKGSVCAMLECILRSAGMKTGLYTSPFLQAYQERIRLNGEPLQDEPLCREGERLLEALDHVRSRGIEPTPFEMGTALALSVFETEEVDVAIVEVGLGGRLDPTNIVSPSVCAITAIGLDHMEFLGSTVEAIAGEKAGIIKTDVPVCIHPATPSVEAVFQEAATNKNAAVYQTKTSMIQNARSDAYGSTADFQLNASWKELRIALPGEHQLTNALTVLAVIETLRQQDWMIPEEAVRNGLATVRWPARLEWCGNILIDGAHNAQGIAALRAFAESKLGDRRRVLVTGVLADKLTQEMLHDIAALSDEAWTVTPDNPRALSAEAYAEELSRAGIRTHACASVEEALQKASAVVGNDGMIIASGSLYFAGMVRNALHLNWRE